MLQPDTTNHYHKSYFDNWSGLFRVKPLFGTTETTQPIVYIIITNGNNFKVKGRTHLKISIKILINFTIVPDFYKKPACFSKNPLILLKKTSLIFIQFLHINCNSLNINFRKKIGGISLRNTTHPKIKLPSVVSKSFVCFCHFMYIFTFFECCTSIVISIQKFSC